MSLGPMILIVSEGWARVFDTGNNPQRGQLNDHFKHGAADPEPERAFLIDGLEVVPLTFDGEQTPFDDQDRAMHYIRLMRGGQDEPVHTISYGVDGRA